MKRIIAALFVLAAASAQAETPPDFKFRCPPAHVVDDGVSLPLLVRETGVWRVDDGILFTQGQGVFWRWVCAYGDPASGGVEAVVHWVEVADEEGRTIFQGTCGGETSDPPGDLLVSETRQAYAELTVGEGVAANLLARDMLRAAEAAALPCAAETAQND